MGDLQSAYLCYSTRHDGYSLQQLLRRATATGRNAHVLVCEGMDGNIFGAFLGFPLRRRASKAYGSSRSFLFDLGTLAQPLQRMFSNPQCCSSPARSLMEMFSLGLYDEIALGLDGGLGVATCQSSAWCDGASLSHRTVTLRSVVMFSQGGAPDVDSRKVTYRLDDSGGAAEAEHAVDTLIADLNSACGIRDYFA